MIFLAPCHRMFCCVMFSCCFTLFITLKYRNTVCFCSTFTLNFGKHRPEKSTPADVLKNLTKAELAMSFERTLWNLSLLQLRVRHCTKKMKFSIKDFSSKGDQTCRKLWIWSNLQEKSSMENILLCSETSVPFIVSKRKVLSHFLQNTGKHWN